MYSEFTVISRGALARGTRLALGVGGRRLSPAGVNIGLRLYVTNHGMSVQHGHRSRVIQLLLLLALLLLLGASDWPIWIVDPRRVGYEGPMIPVAAGRLAAHVALSAPVLVGDVGGEHFRGTAAVAALDFLVDRIVRLALDVVGHHGLAVDVAVVDVALLLEGQGAAVTNFGVGVVEGRGGAAVQVAIVVALESHRVDHVVVAADG